VNCRARIAFVISDVRFDVAYELMRIAIPQRRRDGEACFNVHPMLIALVEVDSRTRDQRGCTEPIAWSRRYTAPVAERADEPRSYRVGKDVDQLTDDAFGVAQRDGGVVIAGPEGFRTLVVLVQGFGDFAINPGHKQWELASGISEDDVQVVGENLHCVQLYAVELGGAMQTVGDDGVDERTRREQELALRHTPRHEVGRAGQNLSRQAHGRIYRPATVLVVTINLESVGRKLVPVGSTLT